MQRNRRASALPLHKPTHTSIPAIAIMKTNSMKLANKYLVGFAAIAVGFSTIGCETMTSDSAASKKKKKDSSWFSFKKKEYQIPQSMTATWSHDILTLPGKAPTRGFGGRFYFYNEKTQAIPVDGDLVVYGFDDTNKQQSTEDLSQANKRFRFTSEQFTTHFTEGELGASYSVWIPWDEAYGAPKKIMLIPTFLTKDGRTVRGAAASLNLPGVSKEQPRETTVQQASALLPSSQPNLNNGGQFPSNPESGLRTTTIQVPPSSLMRQSFTPESQISTSNLPLNQFGQSTTNGPVSLTAPQFFPPPQEQLTRPAAASPISSPNQSKMSTMGPNGWVSPVYAQPDWSSLSPRSAPNQFQAPASQAAQPSVYPTR
jgi:hypothetical protein